MSQQADDASQQQQYSTTDQHTLGQSQPGYDAQPEHEQEHADQGEDDLVRVFVGNIPWTLDKDGLASIFAECGEVADVAVITYNERSKGYGFVAFSSQDAAEKAVAMDKLEVEGRQINVEIARKRDDNQPRSTRQRKPNSYRGRRKSFGGSRKAGNGNSQEFTSSDSAAVGDDETLAVALGQVNLQEAAGDNGEAGVAAEARDGGAPRKRNNHRRRSYANKSSKQDAKDAAGDAHVQQNKGTEQADAPIQQQNNAQEQHQYEQEESGGVDGQDQQQDQKQRRFRRAPRFPRRRSKVQHEGEPSQDVLYIGNLPFNVTDAELLEIFSSYNVVNAHVVTFRDGRSKGFGFIQVSDNAEQARILDELQNVMVNDRELTIRAAFPKATAAGEGVGNAEILGSSAQAA